MSVQIEQATVYRGGGRRWFSKKAAVNAEANKLFRNRYKSLCECSEPEYGDGGMLGGSGETCFFHQSEFRDRFVRRVARQIGKATP